ncbi:MAG: phospholipid/cholesterol/gamma-HCH transport system substrate-binding protein, partial [Mycobacterium sp.]|nr:phospholipid/cholesterol/gamma-HCH transport system substrate-binding protein [Mycobacterium sp.]
MSKENKTRGVDPIWWAPVLVLVVIAVSTLTAMAFEGTLKDTVPLTVISDRAGLVMEDDAKVKLRGVQIGEVAKVESYADSAGTNLSKLKLKIYPNEFRFLPSNIEA